MNILALDLSTKTGWACIKEGTVTSGVQVFDLKRGESPGMRFIRFSSWLCDMWTWTSPELVAWEQAHHRGGAATEVCVGMSTRVMEWAARHEIEHMSVHSATLKLFATGSGRASKADMIDAMEKRWKRSIASDDEADALAILAWAIDSFGPGRG